MSTNENTAPDLTETGVYRFQRALDAACVARIEARFNRPLSPEDVVKLLEGTK